MVRDYYKALVRDLEQQMADKTEALIVGSADLAGYKYGCGQIHGLKVAIETAKAMLSNYEEDDDEPEQ